MKRACQRQIVGLPLPVSRWISIVPTLSALSRTIRVRHTCFCGLFPDPTTTANRSRSPGPSPTSTPFLIQPDSHSREPDGLYTAGRDHWTQAHRRWLARQSFEHAAQQIVFQEGLDAIEDAKRRRRRLDEQLASLVPSWSMAPVVEAYQAMRGASFLVAVTFAAEIGDVRRFDTPRQLMAFLGLVPGERSTGETVRRTSLTLAGNRRARRVLVEAAWTYRFPARVSEALRARLENLPKAVRDIAWKAQVRLCARYRRLSAAGKKLPVVVAAIAREMAAFLWAIGRTVAPS